MPVSTGYVLLEKSIKVFSKPSGLKYKQYFQGYIHFSNRRYTKKKKHLVVQKFRNCKNQFEF